MQINEAISKYMYYMYEATATYLTCPLVREEDVLYRALGELSHFVDVVDLAPQLFVRLQRAEREEVVDAQQHGGEGEVIAHLDGSLDLILLLPIVLLLEPDEILEPGGEESEDEE